MIGGNGFDITGGGGGTIIEFEDRLLAEAGKPLWDDEFGSDGRFDDLFGDSTGESGGFEKLGLIDDDAADWLGFFSIKAVMFEFVLKQI